MMMKKFQHFLLFFLLFGTMLIFGFIENIKGVSYPLIKAEFDATWEQQGFMVSIISIAYVSFSVIAGLFLSRFGIKPSFMFGYAVLGIGLVSLFFLPGFSLVTGALFLVFAGFGFFEIGVNALASRLFVTKAALLMHLLHSFYGIGAILGPKTAGIIADNIHFGWRYVYLFSLPLVLLLIIPAILTRFPETYTKASDTSTITANIVDTAPHKTFFDALRSPMVWLMSVTLGLAVVIEMSSSNWGPLYFQNIYGFNPSTDGATFLSAFFLVFTLSRLVCGPLVERIGYIRSLLVSAFIIFAIFVAGFCLGGRGIYVLPALGFFIAMLWPTLMAVAIVSFGKDAPVFSSAMIAIGGLINAGVQFLVGLTNRVFGSAWGYRSSLVYTVLLIAALLLLHYKLKKNPPGKGGEETRGAT
jgi:fucose permease